MILDLLVNVQMPIFLLIGVGVLMDRCFPIDAATLSKLNFYVFVPALSLAHLAETELSGGSIGAILGFNLAHLLLVLAITWVAFGWGRLRADRPMLVSAALFNNCGNYGLPFAQMAFGTEGIEIMFVVVVFQNLTAFTLGLILLGDPAMAWGDRLRALAQTPVLWTTSLALALNAADRELPGPLQFAVVQLSHGLVPVALLTLGIQLSRARWTGKASLLAPAIGARLVLAPTVALGLAMLWQRIAPLPSPDTMYPVLIAAAGLPVAVNIYILAVEFRRGAELASLIVFWSTLASAITVTLWLVLFRTIPWSFA